MKRRDFLKTSISAAAVGAITPAALFEAGSTPLGLQLWSVRDAMNTDPVGTLTAISKHGYRMVEAFGFKDGGWFGIKTKEFRKTINGLGMRMPSAHFNLTLDHYDQSGRMFKDEFKRVVEAAAEVGQEYLICPYLATENRTKAYLEPLCDVFNEAGRYCKSNGIRFGYHNHAFELEIKFDQDMTMYQYLLDHTEAKYVAFEMDMGWVVRGKYNPLYWFQKYPGRFELSHMKDMVGQTTDTSTIIGNGIVPFKEIIANKKLAGMKYWIIEIEHYEKNSVEDAGACYKQLRKLIV